MFSPLPRGPQNRGQGQDEREEGPLGLALSLAHGNVLSGHLGINNTYQCISPDFSQYRRSWEIKPNDSTTSDLSYSGMGESFETHY